MSSVSVSSYVRAPQLSWQGVTQIRVPWGAKKDRVPLTVIIAITFDGHLFCADLVSLFDLQPNKGRSTIVSPIVQVRKMHREVKCLPKEAQQVGDRAGL